MAIAAIGVLVLLVRADRRSCRLPFLLIAASLVVIAIADASFIGGLRPLDGGEDSLHYEGTARQIADDLWHGHLLAALRGGEDVFYFGGSSFRYPRALERFIFGDTYLGYLSAVLAFPLLMYALFRRLFSVRWALALILIFVVVPVGRLFGTTFTHYAMWAVRGYADPLAVILAVAGYFVLIGVDAERPLPTGRAAFWASFLFAISVAIRPNGAMFAAIMLTGAGLALLYRRHWSRYALLCLGFVPVILPGLHNWYFGHVFVPFVSNWSHPLALSMPPSAWFDAVVDLVRLNWTSEPLGAAVHRLGEWLSGPAEKLAMVPVHAAAIAILIDCHGPPRLRSMDSADRARCLFASILPRSGSRLRRDTTSAPGCSPISSWSSGFRQSGIGMFQRMFPQWSETIRNSSAFRKTAVLLDDFSGGPRFASGPRADRRRWDVALPAASAVRKATPTGAPATRSEIPMIVDIYTHIFPDRFFAELERGSPKLGNMGKRLRGVPKLFDLDLRFKDMDEIGDDYRQIISLPNPPIEDIAEGRGCEQSRQGRQRLDGRAGRQASEALPGVRRGGEPQRRRFLDPRGRPRHQDGRARRADLHQHHRPSARRAAVPAVLRRHGAA